MRETSLLVMFMNEGRASLLDSSSMDGVIEELWKVHFRGGASECKRTLLQRRSLEEIQEKLSNFKYF